MSECRQSRPRAFILAVIVAVGAVEFSSFANSTSSQIEVESNGSINSSIVGYQSLCSRKGVFAVGMREVGGFSGGLKLSSIGTHPSVDGTRLKYYDGGKWNEATYALCTDDAYHWLSKENFLLDDEVVPVGATIVYELAEEAESLCVAGEIGRIEDAVNMTELEMVPKREMEEEVRRARESTPKETVRTIVITNTTREIISEKIILTNKVVVTNSVAPDRFIVRFSDGHSKQAKWSWQLLKAIDPVSGIPLDVNCGDVSFDEDLESPPKERASSVQRLRFYDEQFMLVKRERKEGIGEQLVQKSNEWIWNKVFAVLERLAWILLYPVGNWLWKIIKRLWKKKANKPSAKKHRRHKKRRR